MDIKGDVVIDIEKCKGCLLCIKACPKQVLNVANEVNAKGYQYPQITSNGCTGCANCAMVCPDSVITVYRVKKK